MVADGGRTLILHISYLSLETGF